MERAACCKKVVASRLREPPLATSLPSKLDQNYDFVVVYGPEEPSKVADISPR